MSVLNIKQLGLSGVNVDKDPLEIGDNELRLARNAIHDPLGVNAGLRKRPGLTPFNSATALGVVLGGVGVPLQNMTAGGIHFIYLGRGVV